ncbi:hypothetical protein JUJ52_14170 [Virgibacillus sp. AGTR]|uniref:hypothetical protein n=1 Tax=unclassified Virgibacillus TaxID=2620237 RepID=UPI001D166C5D|nr:MULTISPECIES: hypothetical protein [unclassified Virgibacillus]MCC2251102.1 hypothetical protein [Virgibacillus sp. AGTR]MDY7044577.1 hypothetical protein [Virgibacillus sp. M23]
MVIIAYGLLGVIALHTFQKHSQALSFWKAILFLIIGLISIQLTVGSFDITVFPISVVLLFLIII